MTDWYQRLSSGGPGAIATRRLGLPRPALLRRFQSGQPLLDGPALVGEAPGSALEASLQQRLEHTGVGVRTDPASAESWGALVFDATGISEVTALDRLRAFFQPALRRLGPSGRVLVLGGRPASGASPAESAAQHALTGFIRSLAKETRRGATANLLVVDPPAESGLESTLRFFLSSRSAYISGQVIHLTRGVPEPALDWSRPLRGRIAAVTGAARGIGAAIAQTLARDGAEVVLIDVPAQGALVAEVANRIRGTAFQVDITSADAPTRLSAYLRDRHDGIDVIVHNAGITRDRSLANMSEAEWSSVLTINLAAQLRITDALLEENVLRTGGSVVAIASTSGIAGNRGQANYAASKAGIIGMVRSLAPVLAGRGVTINAVAPGFIETAMTRAMPFAAREIGRRINSLCQGGLPIDVAETVAWLAQAGSGGLNGEVVRVCGQSILGA